MRLSPQGYKILIQSFSAGLPRLYESKIGSQSQTSNRGTGWYKISACNRQAELFNLAQCISLLRKPHACIPSIHKKAPHVRELQH